jgi:hypothetical protein
MILGGFASGTIKNRSITGTECDLGGSSLESSDLESSELENSSFEGSDVRFEFRSCFISFINVIY